MRRSTPRAAAVPGVYLLNTYDLPNRPLYNLTALTLHESAPGHAFQMPIALEHKQQPEFRQHTYISAYGEGWALYCETLGVEMGMYETPYDRFGMLNYQIWRAARLVVDTGIHSQGWSRDQAIAYFTRIHGAAACTKSKPKWTATSPGRRRRCPTTWGRMRFSRRAPRRRRRWARQFNVRAFHDAVLELGSVPIAGADRRASIASSRMAARAPTPRWNRDRP